MAAAQESFFVLSLLPVTSSEVRAVLFATISISAGVALESMPLFAMLSCISVGLPASTSKMSLACGGVMGRRKGVVENT